MATVDTGLTPPDQGPQLYAPDQGTNSFINSLFQPVEPPKPEDTDPFVKKGSLISFGYLFYKHDPYPLIIVTDLIFGQRIRGVNLNYLTFNAIKNLIQQHGENRGFAYSAVKGDRYLVDAFRTYKWQGIRQLKKLNSDFLLSVLGVARSYDPNEMEAIKDSVQEQIQQKVNPKAEEIAGEEGLYTQQPETATKGTIPTTPTIPTGQPRQLQLPFGDELGEINP